MCSDRRLRPAALAGLVLLALAGCGKKGDPLPPPRAVPAAVSDLALRQRGDRVLLEFGHPRTTVAGLPLPVIESVTLVELERPAPAAGQPLVVAPPELAGARTVAELAGAELAAAVVGDRVRIEVALPQPLPEPAVARAYAVRTKALDGVHSAFSNVAVLVPRPAPEAPGELEARPRKEGIEVRWQAVEGAAAGYALLRRAADRPGWGAPLALVEAGVTHWLDTGARYGERYVYTVLALAARAPDIESAPRAEREVDYQDRFAPAPPPALRALALPGQVRLLWEASPDADVAGYRLERAQAAGEFAAVGEGLLTSLEHADGGLAAETVFRYRVVAVDGAGNASEPSATAEVRTP